MSKPIRVLIVDDSALVRSILERGLSRDPELTVVGLAPNPYEARDLLVRLQPDVMTLDVEMPRMDGVTFIRKFMSVLPTPTVVLSSLTTSGSALAIQALEAGAVDVIAKPSSSVAGGLEGMMSQLIERVKAAARARVTQKAVAVVEPTQQALDSTTDSVIGLGASTGGVAALTRILPTFPSWSSGIVVVQHMPAGFTADFARRLSGLCQMKVSEAKHGDRVLRGHILVGPGGEQHVEVRRYGGEYRIHLRAGDLVSGHRPSIDVFFASLAESVGKNAAACLLTGMGADGAQGLLQLLRAGGRTFAQDQETCAVWGMPAAAQSLGAAQRFVPLHEIPNVLMQAA
jgi:two-component system chemotaxis response regulator CheB